MTEDEFEAPPFIWAVIPIVGGIATGVGLILGLGWLGHRLTPAPHNSSTSALVNAADKTQAAAELESLDPV
ncbi:MAG: hypothetical protein DCF21_03715 [Leptolyngbya sp.]|jgi:hypothetical protein|nr:MAG: hypothetical protein DCF21_03715 [Leptolyngbya sp.]